jgi:hypothetical protein
MVSETVTQRIPYCETRREEYVVNQRVAHCVAKQVPYTVTRCVPRCVERQVAFEQCYLVPQTVCSNGCANGDCGPNGNCNVAPDAANPQPVPQKTEKISPRVQEESEPSNDPKPKPAA